MDIWEHKRHWKVLVLYLPHKDTSVYTARYHKLQFHRLERHTVVYHRIMYRNLSGFKDQCIVCNYCKRFLMYLYIDRRHLSLIDPSKYGWTQLALKRSLPDKHWQLPSASFIAPLLASTQIFRAVPSCLHKILPAVLHGWMASDRLQGLQRGPASRETYLSILLEKIVF